MASREASAQQRSGKAPGRGSRRTTDVPTCPEEEESIGSRSEDVSAVDSIVTICENSKNEVGIVCLRMSDFVVDMSSYCDDKTYSKTFSMLTRHEPRQVIFPPAGKDSLLEKIVKNEFPLTRIEHVGRKYWCDVRGLQYVRHYAPHTEVAALETDVNSKYLCLAALAALIDFAASMEQTTFVKGTLRLKYSSAQGVMHLDPSTIRNLEILANARTGNPKGSLWGILSPNVKTCAGARLLRSSLIQPSNDLATIETRQDCTIELLEREEALADIQRILPGLAEVDRVLRAFMQKSSLSGLARAQASIASILHLKQVLRLAPTLAMALSSNGQVAPENNLLTTIQRNLQDEELAEMESAIDTVIEADAVYDKRASQRLLQSLFSIKHSVNNLLDVSRQTLGELTRDMEALTEHYEQALQINLSLNYNQRRGYHFMLPMAERELAERGGFIQLHAHGKKSVSCSTEERAQLNMRCQDMISQILMTTEQARLAADESGGKVSSGSCTHTRACVSEGTCKKRALYRTVGARRAHRVHPVALACTLPIERECRSA